MPVNGFVLVREEGLDAEWHNDHLANELVATNPISAVLEALTKTPHFVRRTGEARERNALD